MPYKHIYLSPHYDDAALSCGGSIHKQARQQEPVAVITVFAGAPALPNAALSKLAQAVHKEFTFLSPNASPHDIVAARRQENEQAMLFLGVDSICLGQFHDSIYRGIPEQNIFFYCRAKDILGDVHPGEATISEEICKAVLSLSNGYDAETVFYAPLAIGNHIDHQITHQVGLALHDAGLKVLFYEDYPYADTKEFFRIPCRVLLSRYGGRLRVLEPLLLLFILLLAKQGWLPGKRYQSVEERAEREGLTEQIIPLSEQDIAAKSRSVAAYSSQVPMLFGNKKTIQERFALRARCLGGERVWRKGNLRRPV